MTNPISHDPDRRIGIYKRLTDVPEQHCLTRFADAYEGRNVWQEFITSQPDKYESNHFQTTVRKTRQSWNDHMARRGRHHALATPHDVETWCTSLGKTRTFRTIYTQYWVRLEQLYSWLYFHTQHPHVYHPVLMAAAEYKTARAVWQTNSTAEI
ncbi:hypothetical protein [Haladaptatus sp. NG-SE-30]